MKIYVERVDADKSQSKVAIVSFPFASTSGLADEGPVDEPSLEIPEPPAEHANVPVSGPNHFQNEVEECANCIILKEEKAVAEWSEDFKGKSCKTEFG